MRFVWIWPPWAVLLVAIVGLALCWLGWRAVRSRQGAKHTWFRRGFMVIAVATMGAGPALP